jgi:hypothetical protein
MAHLLAPILSRLRLTTSHEVHDFKVVTFAHCAFSPRSAGKNVCVSLDRHAIGADPQISKQACDTQSLRYPPVIPVHDDLDDTICFRHLLGFPTFQYVCQYFRMMSD